MSRSLQIPALRVECSAARLAHWDQLWARSWYSNLGRGLRALRCIGIFLGLIVGLLFGDGRIGLTTVLAEQSIPSLTARVTDLTSTLSVEQEEVLEAQLKALESRKGAQVAILLVPTTEPETIEQYSLRVVEHWKLGRKGVDDGVLVLLAMQDRAIRIEVGYGLEGAITDVLAGRIIRDVMTPELRAGNPYGALTSAVAAIEKVLDGEPLPAPSRSGRSGGENVDDLVTLLFALPFIVGGVLRRWLGRPAGGIATFLAATVVGAIVGYVLFGAIIGVIAGLIVAFASEASGGRYSSGGWSSSSGGFGGGGGFSGGGGSFGGGGASGRW